MVKGKPLSIIVYSSLVGITGDASSLKRRVDKTCLRMGCERRTEFATALHKNVAIYISGGCIAEKVTNKCKKFDLKSHKFKKIARMNEER